MDGDPNSDLKTRGFSSFGEPPVTEFIGTAISFEAKNEQDNQGKPRKMVYFNWGEVEIIKAREAYDLPTLSTQVRYAETSPSGWSFLMNSIYAALGGEAGVIEQMGGAEADTSFPALFEALLKDRRWKMAYGPESFGVDRKQGSPTFNQEKFFGVWHLTTEDGEAPIPDDDTAPAEEPTPDEIALGIIDGKTLQQFNQEVAGEKRLKGTPTLEAILKKSWIPAQITANLLTKDAKTGIYKLIQ
jgi:hypothetical protein